LLSSREREVIHELGLGHSNKLIARKLEVRKRASAVAEAHRRGLLS